MVYELSVGIVQIHTKTRSLSRYCKRYTTTNGRVLFKQLLIYCVSTIDSIREKESLKLLRIIVFSEWSTCLQVRLHVPAYQSKFL